MSDNRIYAALRLEEVMRKHDEEALSSPLRKPKPPAGPTHEDLKTVDEWTELIAEKCGVENKRLLWILLSKFAWSVFRNPDPYEIGLTISTIWPEEPWPEAIQ